MLRWCYRFALRCGAMKRVIWREKPMISERKEIPDVLGVDVGYENPTFIERMLYCSVRLTLEFFGEKEKGA